VPVSASTIAAVKLATDLPTLVQEYGVGLRRIAGGYIAKCCFHNEQTASMRVHTVGERAGMYKCFGCSAGGDVFTFVMKIEGIPFNAALEKLAAYAGIPLDSTPVPRAVKQAAKEDAAMSIWWWGKGRDAVLSALYGALGFDTDRQKKHPWSPIGVEWAETITEEYDEEFADCCGRMLRWIENMKTPERLQYFLCHVTSSERLDYRSYVAAEKEFAERWMSLAGSTAGSVT
jgi:hypothetical protein